MCVIIYRTQRVQLDRGFYDCKFMSTLRCSGQIPLHPLTCLKLESRITQNGKQSAHNLLVNCEIFRSDKVIRLTHIYPHKSIQKINVTICNHHVDSPVYLWPAICSGELKEKRVWSYMTLNVFLLRPGVIEHGKTQSL